MNTYKYMHTLDGQPAFFEPQQGQIFFAARSKHGAVRLVDTIKEIHRQQRISAKTRQRVFHEDKPTREAGWVKVKV